jgi:hypothetical protein
LQVDRNDAGQRSDAGQYCRDRLKLCHSRFLSHTK